MSSRSGIGRGPVGHRGAMRAERGSTGPRVAARRAGLFDALPAPAFFFEVFRFPARFAEGFFLTELPPAEVLGAFFLRAAFPARLPADAFVEVFGVVGFLPVFFFVAAFFVAAFFPPADFLSLAGFPLPAAFLPEVGFPLPADFLPRFEPGRDDCFEARGAAFRAMNVPPLDFNDFA